MNGYGMQITTPEQYGQALQAFEALNQRQQRQSEITRGGNPYAMLGAALGGMVANKFGKHKDTNLGEVQQQLDAYQQQQEANLARIAEEKAQREAQAAYERKKADELEKFNREQGGKKELKEMDLKSPTSKMRELAAAGITPDTQEYKAIMSRSNAPVTNIQMPTNGQVQSKFQETLATKNADKFVAWESQAMGANETLSNIQKLKEISQLQQTGKGQEAMAAVSQWFGGEAGSNMQSFNAIQKKMMLDGAASLKGAMSDGEWSVLQAQMPSFGNDPRANQTIMGILEGASQRAIDNFEGASEYAQKNGKLQGYKPKFQFSGSRDSIQQESSQQSHDEYPEGTVIRNKSGTTMVRQNGKWVQQ